MTTNDVANFNGTTSNNAAQMYSSHELASLNLTGYTGTLTLDAGLQLDSGGSMNLGTILNPGAATLTIAGGTFTWTGGNINFGGPPLPALGTLSIQTGATFRIGFTGTGVIDLGDNVTNNGTLQLANTGQVKLSNSPQITNYGTIDVSVNNNNGLTRFSTTDAYKTIANNGTFKKSAGTGAYVIDEPISNQSSASLIQVQTGTLDFTGQDPSTNQNISQGSGNIEIAAGATLEGQSITVSGGTVKTLGTSSTTNPSTIQAITLTINSGAMVNVGDSTTNTAVLYLKYTNLDWNGGTFNFSYNLTAGTGSEVLFDSLGSATISTTGTTVGISFFGTGATPSSWNVMDDSVGMGISNVAQTNPTGWTASLTGGGKIYTLTKNAPLPPHEALVTTATAVQPTSGTFVSTSDAAVNNTTSSGQSLGDPSWLDALFALLGNKAQDGAGGALLPWLDLLLPA